MADDGSNLNETERKIRDFIKKHIGTFATVAEVKQAGDRVKLTVVSPEFSRTANALERIGLEAAQAGQVALDVSLQTWWPKKD